MDDATSDRGLRVVLVKMNHRDGEATLYRSDRKVATVKINAQRDSPIVETRFLPAVPLLWLTTAEREELLVELPTIGEPSPLRSRKVVYLDQNIWSKVALARHHPDRLKGDEAEAALWLADMVHTWRVVLPFSAGILRETSQWRDNDQRLRLASTIAALSRGWQMLHPLDLRHLELRSMLARQGNLPHSGPVQPWTLEPGAALGGSVAFDDSGTERLSAESALAVRAVVGISGIYATILDAEPIPRSDPHGWERPWAQFARHVGTTNKPAHLTELAVHAATIADAAKELERAAIAAGITVPEFAEWLTDRSRSDISRLPAIGLAREVTYLKVRNTTACWEPNDLTDIFYLVQAAGYADAVVGERGFVALVRQAQRRLSRPQNAYPSLHELRASGLLENLEPRPPLLE